jgi:hypothetical protein
VSDHVPVDEGARRFCTNCGAIPSIAKGWTAPDGSGVSEKCEVAKEQIARVVARAQHHADALQRQALMEAALQKVFDALAQATGIPPKAALLVVHWPHDVLLSSRFVTAPPQTLLNAVDAMVEEVRRNAGHLKKGIEAQRAAGGTTDAE